MTLIGALVALVMIFAPPLQSGAGAAVPALSATTRQTGHNLVRSTPQPVRVIPASKPAHPPAGPSALTLAILQTRGVIWDMAGRGGASVTTLSAAAEETTLYQRELVLAAQSLASRFLSLIRIGRMLGFGQSGVGRVLATSAGHTARFQPETSVGTSSAGWSLIGIPNGGSSVTSTQALVNQINGQNSAGTISAVATYRTGRFALYVPNYSASYAVAPGMGIFVRATKGYTWTPDGTPITSGISIPVSVGWSLLSAPYPTGYTATSILKQINDEGGNAKQLSTYRGTYTSYTQASTTDVAISPTQGFWVLEGKPSGGGNVTWQQDYPSGSGCFSLASGATIATNTTLASNCSPYLLSGNLTVNSGVTFTIAPATTINVTAGHTYTISVSGTLLADSSTSVSPITISSAASTPAVGDWGG